MPEKKIVSYFKKPAKGLKTKVREEIMICGEGFEMTVGIGSRRGEAKEEVGVSEASVTYT